MNVKIYDVEEKREINARILLAKDFNGNLPSLTDNWRFNFRKHSQKANRKTYVLVCEDSEDVIEGCLIFEMLNKVDPYMAYIEIAPHNKNPGRKFDKVAGCLIAFASRLSFIHAEGENKGFLSFDVLEENPEDEEKLMARYSKEYKAIRLGDSTMMIILPEEGEKLIKFYLNV